MAYDGKVMREALQRFEEDKQRRASQAAARRQRIYREVPRLEEIEQQLRGTMGRIMAQALRRGEDVYPSELAEALRLSRPRITAALSSLRRKGFLTLTPSQEDRRKVFVRVTEAGMAQIAGQYATVRGYFDRLLTGLGAEDSRELSRLVGRCAQVMKEEKA